MKNKTLTVATVIVMAALLGWLAYANTFETDDGAARPLVLPVSATSETATPGPANGWWDALPTPVAVERR